MNTLSHHMKEGRLYSREELSQFSRSIDLDLARQCEFKTITRHYHGLYSLTQSEITPEMIIRKIMGRGKYLLLGGNSLSPEFRSELQLEENSYLILNEKRADRIETENFTLNFQIPFNGFPSRIDTDFLIIYLMNIRNPKEMYQKLGRHSTLWHLSKTARKYGNKSTILFLEKNMKRQERIEAISLELSSLGAPLIHSEDSAKKIIKLRGLEEILADACEIALEEPRIHNVLPYTIFKSFSLINFRKFEKLTKENHSYRYAGLLLDILSTILPKEKISFKPPKYHPQKPIIAFFHTYSPRAISRIEREHMPSAKERWGILIDTSINREIEKIWKWS